MPSETWQPFVSGHFREEVEMWFQCPSTVMLECDPSTHVIRFDIFSHRWQAKRKLAIFLCSLFVLRWSSKACFSCWQQWDSLDGYYGGWLLSVNSIFFCGSYRLIVCYRLVILLLVINGCFFTFVLIPKTSNLIVFIICFFLNKSIFFLI